MKDECKREGLCELCERTYTVWYAPNDLWNHVVRRPLGDDFHFLCPTCFAMLADARGYHGALMLGPGGPYKPPINVWQLLLSLTPRTRLKALAGALLEQGFVVDMIETKPLDRGDGESAPRAGESVKVKGPSTDADTRAPRRSPLSTNSRKKATGGRS